MNIVCVSYNAPPINSAESLCTIRLLSALAEYGTTVHLVTSDGPRTLDADIMAELTDKRIRVTRVPLPTQQVAANRLAAYGRYGVRAVGVEWCRPAIEATQEVLAGYEDPVLMTRAMPISSNIVGYYCRHRAKGWLAHLSDPYPPVEWKNHWYSPLMRPFNRRWARRFVQQADLVTVTCENATRYIAERSGIDFGPKTLTLPHLGMPRLNPGDFHFGRKDSDFVVGHVGSLIALRRPDVLLEGVASAAREIPDLRLVLYGALDQRIKERFCRILAEDFVELQDIRNLSPREGTALMGQVDVNVIIDTDLGLDYSPFIMSKYVHTACAGKPMLMVTTADSAMEAYTGKFGGGIRVDFDKHQVADALRRLYAAHRQGRREYDPSPELMAQFSPQVIVPPLLERLEALRGSRR